jgi:hypothetical protein
MLLFGVRLLVMLGLRRSLPRRGMLGVLGFAMLRGRGLGFTLARRLLTALRMLIFFAHHWSGLGSGPGFILARGDPCTALVFEILRLMRIKLIFVFGRGLFCAFLGATAKVGIGAARLA